MRSQHICSKVVAVHFGITLELIDNVEPLRVPHYRKHKHLGLNISLHNCSYIVSGETPHSVRRLVQEKPRLVPCYGMLPSIPERCFKARDHLSSNLLPLEPEIVSQKNTESIVDENI
jgi:hypothetical protein